MSAKRFQRLLKVRKMIENQSAIVLAARLEAARLAESQRTQLDGLLCSYLDMGVPNDARAMRQFAEIRGQLRIAIEQQELRIDAAEARVDDARNLWMEKHRDSLSLEKLIERRVKADAVTENRRQQAEQDAWSTRRAFEQTGSEPGEALI